MKNILVLIHDDSGQEARLQTALDLTRAVDGHLTCLDVALSLSSADDYVGPGYGAVLVEDQLRTESDNRARLEQRLANEDVPFEWMEATGDPAHCLADVAAVSDVIVVNRDLANREYPDMLDVAADLIINGRLPVLAVPGEQRGLDLHGKVLVAWDGSRDAEAALRAAFPLLQLAAHVTLLYVEDGSLGIPIDEAARYLSRQGVHAQIQRERALMMRPGSVILSEIAVSHPDYVVMGGFSRSRFVEAAFGGATQSLLTESKVPILIAHQRK